MKKQLKYYDILTTEGANEATILFYGYIGEYYDYDPEKGWHNTGLTDIDFVQELERLAAQYPVINIRINSPGGEVFHGLAIVTAIRQCKAEVHTYIDGVAASMAGVIWLAGHKRHMAKNGMLMLHSASGICWGNAANMRETADTLDQFDNTLILSIADNTGMKQEEVKSKYFDKKDHWLTWNDVSAENWISAPDEYQTEAQLPTNVQEMPYHDLVKFFNQQKQHTMRTHSAAPGLLDRLRAMWGNTIAAVAGFSGPSPDDITHHQSLTDMTLDEFKQSVTDGSLSIEDIKAHIASLEPAPAEPAAEPTPAAEPAPEPVPAAPVATAEITDLKAIITAQGDQIKTLTDIVKAYGQQPGAGKSAPGMPGGDPSTADGPLSPKAELDALNAKLIQAAERNEPVTFLPAATQAGK